MRRVQWAVFSVVLTGGVPAFAQSEGQSSATFWRENLLKNGSFENGLAGWSRRLGAKHDGEVVESLLELDSQTAQDGSKSVTLYGNSLTTRWLALESENITLQPGQRYRLTGWIKTEAVSREGPQYRNSNYYIQFRDQDGEVVESGSSPVRATARILGSTPWREVDLTFTGPENAVFVRVGLVLTMSGRAWFDNIRVARAEDHTWFRKDTQHFLYMSQDDAMPSLQEASVNDAYVEQVAKTMNMPAGKRIRYFKYASADEKKRLTDNDSEAHVEGDDLHALSWGDRRNVAYLIVSRLGPSHPFLVHGISNHLAMTAAGEDLHHGARELIKINAIPPLAALMDPASLAQLPEAGRKYIPASFVAFLIDKHGMDMFKKLYPYGSVEDAVNEVASRFQTVYMNPMPVVDAEWREMLKRDGK